MSNDRCDEEGKPIWDEEDEALADGEWKLIQHQKQQIAALTARLEEMRLPRGNGVVPILGNYWIRMPQGWTIQYTSPEWTNPEKMEWAGPIHPPEERKRQRETSKDKKIHQLSSEVERLRAGLKRLEWEGSFWHGQLGYCPACHVPFGTAHKSDCWLDPLIHPKEEKKDDSV